MAENGFVFERSWKTSEFAVCIAGLLLAIWFYKRVPIEAFYCCTMLLLNFFIIARTIAKYNRGIFTRRGHKTAEFYVWLVSEIWTVCAVAFLSMDAIGGLWGATISVIVYAVSRGIIKKIPAKNNTLVMR